MDGKSVGSRQRLRTIVVPFEMEKEPYGNGGEGGDCYRGNEKNKNYFFIICNAKMYLMRNFASWTKMKSHDMNGDGMLDCCSTWFGGSAGSFFRSRDLVQDIFPIRKDRLDIMMSADSRMA